MCADVPPYSTISVKKQIKKIISNIFDSLQWPDSKKKDVFLQMKEHSYKYKNCYEKKDVMFYVRIILYDYIKLTNPQNLSHIWYTKIIPVAPQCL